MKAGADPYDLIHLYWKDDPLTTLRALYTSTESCYDDWQQGTAELSYLLNYFDRMIFGGYHESLIVNQSLKEVLPTDRYPIIDWDHALLTWSLLERDKATETSVTNSIEQADSLLIAQALSYSYPKNLQESDLTKLAQTLSQIPYRKTVLELIAYRRRHFQFRQTKPELSQVLGLTQPQCYYPIAYDSPPNHFYAISKLFANIDKSTVPFIIMESYDWPWQQLLEHIKDKPAVFYFHNISSLMHLLNFDAVLACLSDPQHKILVGDQHIAEQSRCQGFADLASFNMINTSARGALIENAESIFSNFVNWQKDPTPSNASKFYRLGKTVARRIEAQRLGKSRLLALADRWLALEWRDSHKQAEDGDLSTFDPLAVSVEHCKQFSPVPVKKRTLSSSINKPKIAHIVPQLVDGGHAPTIILRELLTHHNQDHYQIALYSNECWTPRKKIEFLRPLITTSSLIRAHETLKLCHQRKIPVQVDDSNESLVESAYKLASWLSREKIDVGIFHGSDPINLLAATLCDLPVSAFFQHALVPLSPAFDLFILSGELGLKDRAFFEHSEAQVEILHLTKDARANWPTYPFSRTELKLPEEALIITTVSNYLEVRITEEMRWVIAKLLKQFPNAVYAPIGPIHNKDSFLASFEKYEAGIASRIHCLGSQPQPSQLLRSMDLYLNEFPVGGGLSVLDAMAAGCPVVAMYYADGIYASRIGALQMGKEKAIHTGKKEDYLALASRLLSDPEMRQQWKQTALERYELFSDPKDYTGKLEKCIEQQLNTKT